MEARFDELPPRELIASDRHWRVAHATGTSLPGWLVLLPRRHVTALHDLTDSEAAVLGNWQVRLSGRWNRPRRWAAQESRRKLRRPGTLGRRQQDRGGVFHLTCHVSGHRFAGPPV